MSVGDRIVELLDQMEAEQDAERERCARIAEAHQCDSYSCDCNAEIAAAIRSRD